MDKYRSQSPSSLKDGDDDMHTISHLSQLRPVVIPPSTLEEYEDPVKIQKLEDRKDAVIKRKLDSIPEKESLASTKIEPTMSTRIGLQYVNEGKYVPGEPRPKYVTPRTRKQQKFFESRRANTADKFCKYSNVKMSDPTPSKKVNAKLAVPSPEPSNAKVAPRRVTPTPSWLYPYPQTKEELELKKPKSGIIINETKNKEDMQGYDSFELVYSKSPRPDLDSKKKKKKKRKKSKRGQGDEEDEDKAEQKKKKGKKKRKISKEDGEVVEQMENEMEELGAAEGMGEYPDIDALASYLTKQFRRKVSQISAATSYQSKDIHSLISEKEILEGAAVNKYIQKFRRESEVKPYQPKKRKFKRGTLESHSFTNICQPTLKEFFFGSKEGSMHQGDASFSENIRNRQGICMSVAAYCFSILKHPNRWTTENIDQILEYGNNLCIESAKLCHIHNLEAELKPQQLQKYCILGDKKIRFSVEEPEITGYIRSDNKRVYNLTKGLNIFFARQNAGILKTQDLSIAIWKDKYYYMFDAKPRTRDLYVAKGGTAIMANFYDIPSLITVFLDRSNFGNWPFLIYPLKAIRVMNRDDPEVKSQVGLESLSNFNVLNEQKAVCLASFDLADKCFDFARNKQSLPMSVVSLVYSRITPPSAWHRSTIDKIMIIGNQLYLECMECESIVELRLDSLPAIFTLGPYLIEIYIYANVFVDFIHKNCCCQLKCSLEEYFEKSNNAILQIGKCYLAVWKQRNMYYCFDPYPRNNEGFQCRDGAACVSMHTTVESLVNTITTNFDERDIIFHVHALKVCKIHRDPVQSSKFPKHLTMDDFPTEIFKKYKMMKSKKTATEKPITVDYTALAIRRLLAGESPANSIFEIGSTVESLGMEQIPPMMKKHPSRSILNKLKGKSTVVDVIADLDSPSLSDTQIEPELPQQPKFDEDIEFQDLDSFELTMEEIELQEIQPEEGHSRMRFREEMEGAEEEYEAMMEAYGEGEGLDDWYYAMNQFAQVGEHSLPKDVSKISENINTDITYFPIKKEVLYPTYLRDKQQMRYRMQRYKATDDEWDLYIPAEPDITKSEELRKETNFLDLPDDTQIILGTKNVASLGQDVEFVAPFVCIMAGVVSKKYSILTWTTEIVDYILKCGMELYKASKFRYDQVSKLEIPKVTLGNNCFKVLVEYIFDTYIRQNILELAIEKILFVRSDIGVLVTPTYACALIYKNHLFYLYDGFGNNEVGLSEGPENTGVACFSRFKDVHSLAARIMYNKKKRESTEEVVYTRFVLSSVRVKEIIESPGDAKKKKQTKEDEKYEANIQDGEGGATTDADYTETEDEDGDQAYRREEKLKKEATLKVGYQHKNGYSVIEGTKALKGREDISDELKEDHFVCLCACLILLSTPVRKWDTKKVDSALDNGRHVYSHADDLEISEKRIIKNILVGKHFFDIIVKQIKIENWRSNKNLKGGIDTLLSKRLSYFLVQFPNATYVIHRTPDEMFHIFDPYGVPKSDKAGWLQCRDLAQARRMLKKLIVSGGESYSFYNFEVTSIKKAPKDVIISYKLQDYNMETPIKKERIGRPFYEDVEWLTTDPIPWSRKVEKSASGNPRGKVENMWHNWDVEYPRDLYSLTGNIHQFSNRFSEKSRGKQTLANLVTAIGMMDIYELAEWNSAVVDSVLVNGDNYFLECTEPISDEDYELSVDDLKEECSIFPFSFTVAFTPVVEGTMFLVRATQFNLYKALRYFFNNVDRRCGIVCCKRSSQKRQVAFGKLRENEYFMFDCECLGSPMFLDGIGVAYILRTTTMNRLLHVLTLTLRGGDFYIYDVEISDLRPIN
nr:unnamed protein product [Callosobruchus chinensis]